MQLLRQLSKQQQQEFIRLRGAQNGMDEKTFDLCLKYFLEYKNSAGHVSLDKLQIVMKSALFMAEKSQNIENVKGERVSLPSLTLGQLLRSHQLDEVMITLKDFSKRVTVADKQAAADLANLIRQISFLITFHKKFEKSIEKLELKQRVPESGGGDYLKNWSSFAWLLYIQVKNKAFNGSLQLIDNTYMLAHTIAFMLSFAWEYLVPRGILREEKRITEQSQLKDVIRIVRDRVLEMFSIKTMDMYTLIAQKFQTFFQSELVKKGVIKNSSQGEDFLSPELLSQNYRRLDRLYQKTMGPNDLDERIFFKDRLANLTPSKFTPFARQGYANKGKKVNQNDLTYKQNYSSHRILNYQMMDKIQNTMKGMGEGCINLSKLPKTVLASPSSTMKVQLICQTPITAGMQMFNYVNEKGRKFKEMLSQGQIVKRLYEGSVMRHMEIIYQLGKKDVDKKTKEMRESLIYSLFKLALEDYLLLHPFEKDNEKMYQALMVLSIEVVLFVSNSSLQFQDIQREINVSPFEMWKACDFFNKFDKSMPSTLKLHLIDLEAGFVTYKLWRVRENLQMISRLARGEKEFDSTRSEFTDRLFRKLLIQTALQISQLGNVLGFDQLLIEQVFQTMKLVYTQHIDMLQSHNIDQLIMCSLFALNKIQKLELRFTQIIDQYCEINQYNKNIHDVIVRRIMIKEKEHVNLIEFYNKVFILPLKDAIISFKNNNAEHKRNSNNPLLQSPLKDILPRELNKKNVKKAMKDGNTNLLISYNDSPLLKHQPLSFKGAHNPKTRKMIDFDEAEREEKQQLRQHQILSPKAISNVPPEYLKKGGVSGVGGMVGVGGVGGVGAGGSNFNYPWKNVPQSPMVNGLTPSRVSKNHNLANFQLNQFTTNPTPPMVGKMSGNLGPKLNGISGAFGKSGRVNYP